MDSRNGGQSSSDLARQAAARLARQKVLAAYAEKARNAAQNTNGEKLKNVPLTTKIDSESWRKYHSAWQNYYQKYYNDYYSNAAKNYIAKERLKDAREKAEEEEILQSLTSFSKKHGETTGLPLHTTKYEKGIQQVTEASIIDKLRWRIRAKAAKDIKHIRKKRKYVPILAGVFVVILILFLQYNRLIFAPIMAYVSPGNAPISGIDAIDPTVTQTVSADPRLIIPKINVDVPIRFGVSLEGVMEAMANGVAHYRIAGASAFPGEVGNFVITGHSAGDVYSSNPYKYIFSGLERLEDGDLIYVNYNSIRYTYRVIKKQIVDPSNVASLVIETDKPLLTLVTCTPLGTSRNRLLVTAEQISPDYNSHSETEQATPVVSDTTERILPSNEPSFLEGLWNFLTGQ